MEKRPYFVIGDLIANILVATAAVALTTWLIGGSWGMIPGMIVGMVLGMIIAIPLTVAVLAPLLGIMEVMAPCMLGGMFGGMWGGMWPLQGEEILRWGVGTGIVSFAVVYVLNTVLSGPQRIDGQTGR
ncbi:MAG: hypothetical protein ACN4GT_12835 [Gammaproteobacteria bacterium]